MVKAWTRARGHGARCGLCGAEVPAGDPIRVYTMRDGLSFLRCGPCEGGAPPDLPAVIVFAEPQPAIDFTRIGLLPLDFKRAAAAEREPGEEG